MLFENEIRGPFNINSEYSLEADFDDFNKFICPTKNKSLSPERNKELSDVANNEDFYVLDNSDAKDVNKYFSQIQQPNGLKTVKPNSGKKFITIDNTNSRKGITTNKASAEIDGHNKMPKKRPIQGQSKVTKISNNDLGDAADLTNPKSTPRLWARHANNLMAKKLGTNTKK